MRKILRMLFIAAAASILLVGCASTQTSKANVSYTLVEITAEEYVALDSSLGLN
ncbi:hypothetical protein SAMN02910368_01942 [Lachnospiraceae bacterium G11]|jgi:uncharacterized protein YcfL|nr:hypothetical protein SAMN02910368_01942 [Lachnospiraceae bacterium G11]